jgi:ligand-binding sensor domain-containing protein/serine phosphatase RsbU (regulator of sigma subunit)
MKKHFLFILAFFIFACKGEIRDDLDFPENIITEPISATVKMEDGYLINAFTNDSVKTLIGKNGDTIRTGRSILMQGITLDSDTLASPTVYKVKESDFGPAYSENFLLDPKLQQEVLSFEESDLYVVDLSMDTTEYLIVNSIGDSVPTNKTETITGKVIPCLTPKPIKAISPGSKESSVADFQFFNNEHGLSSSNIMDITTDERGDLWFASNGTGVIKYDGEYFWQYSKEQGLTSNRIWSTMTDSKGNLWFGTLRGGLCKYDGQHFTEFNEEQGFNNSMIISMIEDRNGDFWLGTWGGGVIHFKPTSDNGATIKHYTSYEGLSYNIILSLLEDENGKIWVGTYTGALCVIDPEKDKIYQFPAQKYAASMNIRSLFQDNTGTIWAGTRTNGLSQIVLNESGNSLIGKITNYNEGNGFQGTEIFTIHQDSLNRIWTGSRTKGISQLNFYSDSVSHINRIQSINNFTTNEGLSSNLVLDIESDQAGNLWIGTEGGGVCKHDIYSFKSFNVDNGLCNTKITALHEDSSGRIWFGTSRGGVCIYDHGAFTSFNPEPLKQKYIGYIQEDKYGNFWICSDGDGVFKYNPNEETLENYSTAQGLPPYIMVMEEDQEGNLWFGTNGRGLIRMDLSNQDKLGELKLFEEEDGFLDMLVHDIYLSMNGNLWFATANGAGSIKETNDGYLCTFYSTREGLPANKVTTIHEDKNGDIWIGIEETGLVRFKLKENTFELYTIEQGLSNNTIFSITETAQHELWIGNRNGLDKITFIDNKNKTIQISSFGKSSGLNSSTFTLNNSLTDSENNSWLANINNITYIDNKLFKSTQSPPDISLSFIEINENFIDFNNRPDSLSEQVQITSAKSFTNIPQRLELLHDQNHLTFHFTSKDPLAKEKVRYSYRLSGFEDDWSSPSKESKADYRNISYGDYTFMVSAIGESGEWSEPYSFNFKIHPPWWHSWWARTIYIFIGLYIIILLIQLRTRKLKRRQIELEEEIANATVEIRSQKTEIEEQHQEIKDSIDYAKRIQTAILPPTKLVKEHLNQSFVMYLPKDVVAGDFYWMEPQDNKILFAAADCTGHGVPGAMVSVVCNHALNRSVREYKLEDPGRILDKARELVIKEFEKGEEEVKDGMDIALCSLEGTILKYSGAHNPLWIVRKGTGVIEEIKANKQPIGKFDKPEPFLTHEIVLNPGDCFYIFSDGFADQFGGEKGKKFKSSNFKELILSVQDLDMDAQKEKILQTFNEWKANFEQLDDVCVIGVKV